MVLAALVAHAERRAGGGGWDSVDPYVVRGLARHASRAGAAGIGMLRGLVERGGASAAPILAQALILFSQRLRTEGRPDDALSAAREALTLYKELERTSPGDFSTALVRTLINVANRYADIGDREGHCHAAREAVELQRSLADAGGSAGLPDLALALGTLGRRVHDIGDREGHSRSLWTPSASTGSWSNGLQRRSAPASPPP